MNFTHYDLGKLDKGRIVEVHLKGSEANVYLLDQINLGRYKKGLDFKAIGGLTKSSPVRLRTTSAAIWHIAVDLPNGYGTVKTSYRVLTKVTLTATNETLQSFNPSSMKTEKPRPIPTSKPVPVAPSVEAVQQAPVQAKDEFEKVACGQCMALTVKGKFCMECGAPMIKVCPQCSVVTPPNGKFCFECGYKF